MLVPDLDAQLYLTTVLCIVCSAKPASFVTFIFSLVLLIFYQKCEGDVL
jgi:hypothetical protein